jgi:hypothetical protein
MCIVSSIIFTSLRVLSLHLVLIAVADTNYRIVCVDTGSYGEDSDFTILKRSTLWTSVQTNMLELPSERPLAGLEGPNVP